MTRAPHDPEVQTRSKKMAAAFRNEGSCLLLFYAIVRGLRFRKLRMPGQHFAPDSTYHPVHDGLNTPMVSTADHRPPRNCGGI
jgi:hypothetical protein